MVTKIALHRLDIIPGPETLEYLNGSMAQNTLDDVQRNIPFHQPCRQRMPLWHNKDKSENPCVATGWLVCPYSFSTKKGP